MAQWLRIRLLMQGIRVRALVQEDPTCRGAAKPITKTAEPTLWSPRATDAEPVHLEPVLHKRSHFNEKSAHHNEE